MLIHIAGYGFPTTFGLVIASILGVSVIRLFIVGDTRRNANLAIESVVSG